METATSFMTVTPDISTSMRAKRPPPLSDGVSSLDDAAPDNDFRAQLRRWITNQAAVLTPLGVRSSDERGDRILVYCTKAIALSAFAHGLAHSQVCNARSWPEEIPPECVVAVSTGPTDLGVLWMACVRKGVVGEGDVRLVPIPQQAAAAYQSRWIQSGGANTTLCQTFRKMMVSNAAHSAHAYAVASEACLYAPRIADAYDMGASAPATPPPMSKDGDSEMDAFALPPPAKRSRSMRSDTSDNDVAEEDESDEALAKRLWVATQDEARSIAPAELDRLRGMLDAARARDVAIVERGSMAGLYGTIHERVRALDGLAISTGPTDGGRIDPEDAQVEAMLQAYRPLSELASLASAVIKRATPLIRPLLTGRMIEAYRAQVQARRDRLVCVMQRATAPQAPRTSPVRDDVEGDEERKDMATIMIMRYAQAAARSGAVKATRNGDVGWTSPSGALDEGTPMWIVERLKQMSTETWEKHIISCAHGLGRERAIQLIEQAHSSAGK